MSDSFSDQLVGSVVQSCPAKNDPAKKLHWIEIQLVGEDDQGIPWEEYLVELPDGTRQPGYLDGNGFARLSGFATGGTCKVSFPKLDRDAWVDA